jgi:[ribosomal protein S18]-alanine N-acetyltransferase
VTGFASIRSADIDLLPDPEDGMHDAWRVASPSRLMAKIDRIVTDDAEGEVSLRGIRLATSVVDDALLDSIRALCEVIFTIPGTKRLELRCDASDHLARTVLAWSGATLEGTRRRASAALGTSVSDEAVFSVLKGELTPRATSENDVDLAGVVIRPATMSDLGDVYQLERDAFGLGYDLGHLRQFLTLFAGLILIATTSGESAGYLLQAPTHSEPSTGWILSVGVRRDLQGRGIGRMLLGEGLITLRSAGVQRVRVTVDPTNRSALALYRRFGFVEGEITPHYFGPFEDRLTMSLELDAPNKLNLRGVNDQDGSA